MVSQEQARSLANEIGIHYFTETSAKTGDNLVELFSNIAMILYKDHLVYKERIPSSKSSIGKDNAIKLSIENESNLEQESDESSYSSKCKC